MTIAWRGALREKLQHLPPSAGKMFWPALLHRARRILLDGGRIFVMADGAGRDAFHLPLPGGAASIKPGWLALHQHTGARVLPVLTHLEGRTQVITIHPALPTLGSDPVNELGPWRTVLGCVLADYVRRFPGQCPRLAVPVPEYRGPVTGSTKTRSQSAGAHAL